MPGFSFLEHPSDIGILATGQSRESALVEGSKGLTAILADPTGIQLLEERLIRISGSDIASQVVNWLDELLFLFDTEGMLFADFRIDAWTASEIHGCGRGEPFDATKHELRTAVKAVTYHQFDMRETAGGWELRVFVDL
jgi:SHS2 domain-containing protein